MMSNRILLNDDNVLEPGIVAYTCNSSTRKAEAKGWLQIWGWHWLHNEFQVNMGYTVRPWLWKTETKQTKNTETILDFL